MINLKKLTESTVKQILEGADVSEVLGINCSSTILRDMDITSPDDAEELILYIINDGDLYRRFSDQIVKNLQKKYRSGKFDKELAIKAFMPVVDAGVRKYDKEFVSGTGKLFLDKATRTEIAQGVYDYYQEQIEEEA